MQNKNLFLFAVIVVLCFSIGDSELFAQKKKLTYKQVYEGGMGIRSMMGMIGRSQGWVDDEHYIESKADPAKPGSRPIAMKVNAGDGKSGILFDNSGIQLPEGFSIDQATGKSKDYNYFLFKQKNNLYYYDRIENSFKQLTNDDAEEKIPQLSPDSKKVAYVKNNNLCVYDIENEKEIQFTNDGTNLIYNGWASWVYMEEILGRVTAYNAFWWSPNSEMVCFLRFDDNPVPDFPIYHADGQHGELEHQRYPKAGDPNPYVRFGVANVQTSKVVWADFDEKADQYIAWPTWLKDSRLTVQWMNRGQNNIIIYNVDANTGKKSQLFSESQKTWVEWFTDVTFLKNNNGFILRSNVDGFSHLYLYDQTGKLKNRITQGEWEVTSINLVDEANKKIYFTGWKEKSTERHLFVVGFNGKDFRQLTTIAGTHTCMVSPSGKYFIDSYSNISTPTKVDLYKTEEKLIRNISETKNTQSDEFELAKTELFTIPSGDGYDLPALWSLPAEFDPNKKYTVIISIYGGPNSASVRNSFPTGMGNSYLASKGIITLAVDHRGSGQFGKRGQNLMYRNLGKWELNDYIAVVKWLRKQSFIDSTKIGITGGSYGGYVTALALTKGADYFTHGIAEFGVMDWQLYDNVYTERYMDTPKENPEGYKEASVFNYVNNYKGKMLITHGTIDDNVHTQNSIQLILELEKLNKDFEMMFYPNQRHGIGMPLYLHAAKERLKFWFRNFLGRELDVNKD
jgi:dipeptidyl-peptidase 4